MNSISSTRNLLKQVTLYLNTLKRVSDTRPQFIRGPFIRTIEYQNLLKQLNRTATRLSVVLNCVQKVDKIYPVLKHYNFL